MANMLSLLPMKNSKKTQNNNRININETVAELAQTRLGEIQNHLHGTSRLRSSRWPGETSVYDTHRILSVITSLAYDDSINVNRITSLQHEVDNFATVLSPNLSRSLTKMLKSQET